MSGNVFILFHSWRIFSLNQEFWVYTYFYFKTLNALFGFLVCLFVFVMRSQLQFKSLFPICDAFPRLFSELVVFSSIIISIIMVLFVFILLGVHQASWACKFISFTEFVKFLALNFSNIFSVSFSFFLFSRILVTLCLVTYFDIVP